MVVHSKLRSNGRSRWPSYASQRILLGSLATTGEEDWTLYGYHLLLSSKSMLLAKTRLHKVLRLFLLRELFRSTAAHMPADYYVMDPHHPAIQTSLLNFAFQQQEDTVIAKDVLAPNAWGVCCFCAEQQLLVRSKGEGEDASSVERAILHDSQFTVTFAAGSEYAFKKGSKKCDELLTIYKRVTEASFFNVNIT